MAKRSEERPTAVVVLALVLLAFVVGVLIQTPPNYAIASLAAGGLAIAAGWLASRRIRRRLNSGIAWAEKWVLEPLDVVDMLWWLGVALFALGVVGWRLVRWVSSLP